MTETANLIQSAVLDLKATTVTYAEYERRLLAGKYADPLKTRWGAALDKLERARQLKVDPPPPSGWTVEPPRDPYTSITNAPTLALNATELKQFADVKIDGTGDTAALFQGNAHGSSLRRCVIRRASDRKAVTWDTHAVYGKARNLTLEDIDAECSSQCASGFSLRFDGAVLRRFRIVGAPHAVTYYETSGVAGTVLVEQGSGSFTNPDTAVWMDAETDYQTVVRQAFVFRDVHFTGPASAKFLRIAANRMQGTVRIEGCTINGRPVTASDVAGVPLLTVT